MWFQHWSVSILWLCWLSYWILAAARGRRRRRSEAQSSRSLHIALLAVAFFLLLFRPLCIGPLSWRVVPAGALPHAIGLLIALAGLLFTVWARSRLGENWSAAIAVEGEHQLVRTGPYALVRHPIYSGLLLAIAGTAVSDGSLRAFLGAALACVAYLRKIGVEEALLLRRFGTQYEDYRRRVKALVPFVV